MKKIINLVLLSSIFVSALSSISCSTISSTTQPKNSFKNFYVLGDSLSDTGGYEAIANSVIKSNNQDAIFKYAGYYNKNTHKNNLASASNDQPAVEWVNNLLGFGNMGPAGELLSDEYKGGRNYAISGARASDDITLNLTEIGIRNFKMKADLFSQASALTLQNKLSKGDLVFIEIGGNDMNAALEAFLSSGSIKDATDLLNRSKNNISKTLDIVLKTGATVLYMNSPDLTLIPILKGGELDKNGKVTKLSEMAPKFTSLIKKYDMQFSNEISEIIDSYKEQYKGQIEYYDLYGNFKNIMNDYKTLMLEEFGLKINTSNNFGYSYTRSQYEDKTIVYEFRNDPISTHENMDINEFFFIDGVHPTKYVHQFVGKLIYNEICDLWYQGLNKVSINLELMGNDKYKQNNEL